MTSRSFTTLFVSVGYPIALHITILLKKPVIGFMVMLAVLAIHLTLIIIRLKKDIFTKVYFGMAMLALFSLLVYVARTFGPAYPLFIPPLVINAFLFVLFVRTLLPGHTPLISSISKAMHGKLPPELGGYTRKLTLIWALFFAVMFLESLLLSIFAPLEVWSLFTNILNYIFILLLVVGEYIFRIYYLPNIKHSSPIHVIIHMVKRGFVSSMRAK